jgi:serine protease Do
VELDKKVELELTRNGKSITTTAQIREQPANFETARVRPTNHGGLPRPPAPNEPEDEEQQPGGNGPNESALGSIAVRELTPQLAQSLGVPPNVRGVVVAQVGENAGQLRPGDVIEAINQEPIDSVQDFETAVQSLDPNQPQVLSVCRQRTRSFVVLKPR